jgi:hypothetical protein
MSKIEFNRRQFLTRGLAASAGIGVLGSAAAPSAGLGGEAAPASERVTPCLKGTLPAGKIGKLGLSRLISGGNLLSGWCHQRDLLFVRNLATAYLTERKQHDTLQLMEELGINSIIIDMVQLDILNQYRRQRGGKMRAVVSVRQDWGDWGNPSWESLKAQIRETIAKGGADLLYLHGGYSDRLVQSGKPERIELIGKAVEYIREQGLSAGIGAHELEVLKACDRSGIQCDFYVKTFHHDRYWSATPRERRKPFSVDGPRSQDHNEFHDNIFCLDAEGTAAYFAEKTEPWIAFKVLAAGAIQPRSGFKYAFENGADFVAVGMFDFEVGEDVLALKQTLDGLRRERPWCG